MIEKIEDEEGLCSSQFREIIRNMLLNFIRKKNGHIISQKDTETVFTYTDHIEDIENVVFTLTKSSNREELKIYVCLELNAFKYINHQKLIQAANRTNINMKIPNFKIFANESFKSITGLISLIQQNWLSKTAALELLQYVAKLQQCLKQCILKSREVMHNKQSDKKPLKALIDNINVFKITVDQQIRNRKKNTLPPSNNIFVHSKEINCFVADHGIKNDKKYDGILSMLRKSLLINEETGTAPILQKINILEKQEIPISQSFGNFGDIKKWKSTYEISDLSITQSTNQLMNSHDVNDQKENKILKNGYLIQKCLKISDIQHAKIIQQCFDNQINIIKYLRNFRCENIASYYLQGIKKTDQKILHFYLDYYPKSVSDSNFKAKYAIYICKSIAKSLYFLSKANLIHRDLKPHNIMLTDKFVPKLIDFGSSTFTRDSSQNPVQFRTTKYYNLYYIDAPEQIKQIMNKQEFQSHLNYDIMALGVMIRELLVNGSVAMELGQLINKNVVWVIAKCLDPNPENRMNSSQVEIALSMIWKLWKLNHEKSK